MMRDKILSEISRSCEGLIYISETDEPITAFLSERRADEKPEKTLLQLSTKTNEQVEEINFDNFFERLTGERDWHGAKEKERVQKFRALKKTLEDNLTQLKVLKFGRVRKDIFVVGRDKDNRLLGVRTESVET
ncbi:MAG: nuclease A inhibitor family protein [Pyrinomonadaceae bacterium]